MAKYIRVTSEFDMWLVPGAVERNFPVGHEGYEVEKVVEEGLRLGAIEVISDGRKVREPQAKTGFSGESPAASEEGTQSGAV